MSSYKICVYAICKNEEAFVDRWMDAVSEADLVVVLDTGSTDNTIEKLEKRGAVVYSKEIKPWRFDTARNIAMEHIPDDFDICVSNDLDEVFEKGWRKKLEEKWKPLHTRAEYLFTWSYHPDGTPDKQFTMAKIHSRHGFRWVHPVHEILEYSGESPDITLFIHDIVLNHYPDTSKPRSQYLPLLELSVQENPDDDRAAFWLGREYMYYEKYDDCISVLKQYLTMPSAIWDEERCAAMRFIARSHKAKSNFSEALSWIYRSIAECPHTREPYLELARYAYEQNDWPLLYFASEKGLTVIERTISYLVEPEAWKYAFYDYGAIACFRLGLYEKAHEYAVTAYNMEPENERLRKNMESIQPLINKHSLQGEEV